MARKVGQIIARGDVCKWETLSIVRAVPILLGGIQTNLQQRYRLVGVGWSNFREPEGAVLQPDLID